MFYYLFRYLIYLWELQYFLEHIARNNFLLVVIDVPIVNKDLNELYEKFLYSLSLLQWYFFMPMRKLIDF